MKTHFIRIIGVLLVSLLVSSSFAQVITKIDTLATVYIYSYSTVNKEVHNAFKRDFKDAAHPRWYAMDENYLVKFISNDQKNQALYNSKGNIIYHIAYGNEQALPKFLTSQIKAKYPAADIISAVNVNQDQRNIWVVNLKEKNDLVLVRVEDERIEEVDRMHDVSS